MSLALQLQATALIQKKKTPYEVVTALSKYKEPELFESLLKVYPSVYDRVRILGALYHTEPEKHAQRCEELNIHPASILMTVMTLAREKGLFSLRRKFKNTPFEPFLQFINKEYLWCFYDCNDIPENLVSVRSTLLYDDKFQLPKGFRSHHIIVELYNDAIITESDIDRFGTLEILARKCIVTIDAPVNRISSLLIKTTANSTIILPKISETELSLSKWAYNVYPYVRGTKRIFKQD